jgi:hypothetical protein
VSSIFEMLRNELYRGVLVWNQTKKERNPETDRTTSRPLPESDWKRIEIQQNRKPSVMSYPPLWQHGRYFRILLDSEFRRIE